MKTTLTLFLVMMSLSSFAQSRQERKEDLREKCTRAYLQIAQKQSTLGDTTDLQFVVDTACSKVFKKRELRRLKKTLERAATVSSEKVNNSIRGLVNKEALDFHLSTDESAVVAN